MDKGQFAILRFAKYKGPEISNIEAHNERTKEKYASNPDVDTNRSKNNFHIIQPTDKYRAMSEALIKQYDCPRVRSDSVRIVETLITASPEFFKGKKKSEIRGFFEHAVDFLKQELGEDRLISRRRAYGRENAPYARFFCPDHAGRASLRQAYPGQSEDADGLAGSLLEAHGQQVSRAGARRERQ